MTHLILIRHAQTVANIQRRWIGWGEAAITPLGRAQIAAVARRVAAEHTDVAAIYTSPFDRARETAEVISAVLGLEPTVEEDFKEINFGELDGITIEEMAARYPQLHARWQNKADSSFQWPEGEQRAAFFRRVGRACDRVIARYPHDTVVIVAHGGTLRGCLAHLLPDALGQWWTYTLDNCAITRVETDRAGARLIVLNDTTHLPQEESKHG